MMTTREVAATLGVPHQSVYRAIKQTGMRWRLEKRKGLYMLTNDDVIEVGRALKARNLWYLIRTLTPNSYMRDASHPA